MIHPRIPVLLVLVLSCVWVQGCGLFDTRPPEDPTVVRSTFDPPSEPLTVLENLKAAVRESNDANYLRCLSDSLSSGSLEFTPTPDAASRYGVFVSWTKQNEQEYFLNLRSRMPTGTGMSLSFGTPSLDGVTSDSVLVEATYDFSAPHGQQGMPDRGVGRAQFMMYLDRRTGYWSIRRWRDLAQDATTPSWSDLKGAFSQ